MADGADAAVASPDDLVRGNGTDVADVAEDEYEVIRQAAILGPRESILDVRPPAVTVRRAPFGIPMPSLDERIGRILLSIILALLLWFYVTSLENPEQVTVFRGLSVDLRGTGSDLKVINTIPTVETEVHAPQDVMGRLRQSDIRPYIDLSKLGEGVHQVPVRAEIVGTQSRLVTVRLAPNEVQVQLEAQVTREFTLTTQVTGTPALGYGVEPAQVKPDRVTVTGGKDAVGRIARVVVAVDIDQKAGTQQGLKPPVALDGAGREIREVSFSPASVEVVVPIKLLFNYKEVQVMVPVVGQPASGFRVADIKMNPSSVTICCSPGLLDPIKTLSTVPLAVTGTTSTIITTTELILPTGVELYPGQSTKVAVTLSVEAYTTTLQLSVVPAVTGLPPGVTAVVSPNRLDVTLAGTFAQVQNLNPGEVHATINVEGRQPGTYDIQPEITVPSGVTLESASPQRVTVTIIPPTPVPATATLIPQVTPTQEVSPTIVRPVPTTPVRPVPTTPVNPTTTQPSAPVPTISPSLPVPTTAVPLTQQPQPTATSQPTASPTPVQEDIFQAQGSPTPQK
jgi:YbbR domain-containing protein